MKLGYENWIQIPCAPKYEINARGDVRNIKTKQFIKWWVPKGRVEDKRAVLYVGEDYAFKTFHQSGLLWLTHGIIPKRKTHSRIAVPVIISHGNESHWFESCRQAAQFIANRDKKLFVNTIVMNLARRQEEIHGWRINYQR